MKYVKLSFVLLFCYILVINSTDLDYTPHISAVLQYLNANPNKVYDYKKGAVIESQQKVSDKRCELEEEHVNHIVEYSILAPLEYTHSHDKVANNVHWDHNADIIELSVSIDVNCVVDARYEGVPCTERQQICTGFLQKWNENNYKVLSDITCEPKEDNFNETIEDVTTDAQVTEQGSNIELSHESVSSEQKADFIAAKVNSVPCLGCPFDLDTNAEGVSTLVNTVLRHLESERTQKHIAVKIIKLQQQVVAGVKYILILEVVPTVCQKDVDPSSNCPRDDSVSTSICEVVFFQQPWINKSKYIIKNNCTVSQEFNVDVEKPRDNELGTDKNSENAKPTEMRPEALLDLESQILPETQKKSPISDVPDSKNSFDSHLQVTSETIKAVHEIAESQSSPSTNTERGYESNIINNNDRIDSSSNEENIKLNRVKRSISEVQENQQAASGVEHRYRRDVMVGAPGHIDVNDSRILEFTQDALVKLDTVSNTPNKYQVVDITSATSQVVAGIKYVIKVEISLSDCLKNESTQLESCGLLQNAKIEKCEITIWDRPWLNKRETTLKCDGNENTYTFDTSPERHERSINRGYGETIESTSEGYESNPKILDFIETGLQRLNLESIYKTKYILKKILKISRQTISGSLWLIEAEIALSNCPKQNYIEQCDNDEINKSKICHFKIWEQPWLTDTPKINIICENDAGNEHVSGSVDAVLNAFQDFVVKYNKSYINEINFRYRLKVFRDNLKTINLLNKYERGSAKYGVTQFADLTESEFSKSHGLRLDLHNENSIPFLTAATPNVTLPKEFDWRTKGVVTKVKNQGSCGSCWAFSTTGNVEGQYAIKYGNLLEFSEQELVDCDKLDEGCNGGLMDNAYRTIEQIGGLETETDYPYDAIDEKCHFSRPKVRVQVTGALNISHNETDMAKWLVQNGPIAIGINANAMQFYFGGVSHPWKMLCNPKNLDHGVLIVGYGVHYYPLFNKTLPYWIIKNSWGPSWGEQGYYRVYRGDGTCGVNQTPSSSIVA